LRGEREGLSLLGRGGGEACVRIWGKGSGGQNCAEEPETERAESRRSGTGETLELDEGKGAKRKGSNQEGKSLVPLIVCLLFGGG